MNTFMQIFSKRPKKTVKLVYLLFKFSLLVIVSYSCAADTVWLNNTSPDYGFPNVIDTPSTSDQNDNISEVHVDQDLSYPDLNGYWMMKHVTYKASLLPVLLEEVLTRIEATLLVEVKQTGNQLILHEKTCDVFMFNEPGFGQTIIPDAFIASLAQRQRAATLLYVQNEETQALSIQMQSDRYEDFRGVKMNVFDDEFPTTDHSEMIIDSDEDGHPGLTVQLIGFPEGDVYLIQKMWDRLLANVVQDDLIEGLVEWEDEQLFLGATNEALLIEVDRWIPGPAERHHFSMTRSNETTCPSRQPPPVVD